VRITGMNGVDLARFEFDFDTTWHAFFLDANLNIYSRYGGRDEDSADGRQSVASLLTTMREVLEVHERRQTRDRKAAPAAGDCGGAPGDADFHPAPGKRTTPEDIPLLRTSHRGCVHCHQVAEYRLLQDFHKKAFKPEQLFGFPLPENVGIRFDRAHGHKIEKVIDGSAAATAGLQAGDVVTRVSDVPVHSEQDLRWALHRALKGNQPTVTVARPGSDGVSATTVCMKLILGPKWRETELGWRKSLRSVPLPMGFLAYALGREERRETNFPDDRLAIKVVSIRGGGLGASLGLEKGDFITALEGSQTSRSFEDFKSDLLRRYRPGDFVHVTVLRNGKPIDLEGPFPDWHTTDTSVP
jgi:predicted metalloprotease with PDZ domain